MEKPLVSVIMITYNHENFIEEAIKSVLQQRTDFLIEFIIANDCSKDNTHNIILKLINLDIPKNFKINYINHNKNIGMMPNFLWALENTKGKYVALCEGDDYWLDNNKLQKQVEFLENNLDYSISYHRVKYLRNNQEIMLPHHLSKNEEKDYNIEDLAKSNFINTLSVVFRNSSYILPSWFTSLSIGDYPLWLILAENGKIKYFPDVMGVYRDGVGYHTRLPKIKQIKNTIEALEIINNYFLEKKNNLISEILLTQINHHKKRLKDFENYKKSLKEILKINISRLNFIQWKKR